MKKGSILMVALAGMMIAGGMLKAGEVGTVKLNKDVYEVGEKDATVTVTDGTGGYKAGVGSGFGQVEAAFDKAGKHPVTISNEPSKALNDSGVVVTYPAPASGEEEKSVTEYCTVVKLTIIKNIPGPGVSGTAIEYIVKSRDFRFVRAYCSFSGEARPVGFEDVEGIITAPKLTGLKQWRPETYTGFSTPPNYTISRRFYLTGNFPEDYYKPARFNIKALYASLEKESYILITKWQTVVFP